MRRSERETSGRRKEETRSLTTSSSDTCSLSSPSTMSLRNDAFAFASIICSPRIAHVSTPRPPTASRARERARVVRASTLPGSDLRGGCAGARFVEGARKAAERGDTLGQASCSTLRQRSNTSDRHPLSTHRN